MVRSAELWLWHSGGPLTLRFGGSGPQPQLETEVVLGAQVSAGQRPQVVIAGGVWQSAIPASASEVLVSCVVAPGFDFADFTLLP